MAGLDPHLASHQLVFSLAAMASPLLVSKQSERTDSNSLLREVAGETASSQGGFEGLIPSGHTLTERTLPYLAIETGIKHWVNNA